MPTFIDQFFGRPFAIRGMLWSLGLHASAFAAIYSWWSSPIAPPPVSDVVFAGDRYVTQIEAILSEMPSEQEIETCLEFESTLPLQMLEDEIDGAPPLVDVSPLELPRLKRELVITPAVLQLPDSPLQDDDANEISEVKPPRNVSPPQEPHETGPVETPKRPRSQPIQPPMPETTAVVEQFAGVEERVPPDLTGNRPPSYPAEAIRRRLEGVVLLRIHIAAAGHVEHVEIVKSSGHAILDRTAVEAVSTWHARPAEQEGKLVATVEILPIRFQL